jgi:hypothetical protein
MNDETKKQLIERMSGYIDMAIESDSRLKAEQFFDEISAHAIREDRRELLGDRPESCMGCDFFRMKSTGALFKCGIKKSKKWTQTLQYEIEYSTCPLPPKEKV